MSNIVEKFFSSDWNKFKDKINNFAECNHTLDHSKAILKNMGYSN